MSTPRTAAEQFQNALRILHSLDEVRDVLPAEKVRDFHLDPMGVCLRMDPERFAQVYELIERRQPKAQPQPQPQPKPQGVTPELQMLNGAIDAIFRSAQR